MRRSSSTEALPRFWLATGLSFAINHVEQAFDKLFELPGEPAEYSEFSTKASLRSDPKDRIEMLARAVRSEIYGPNEARAAEDLDAVEFGDEPRCQSQVVPLSAASAIPNAPPAAASPAAPAAVKARRLMAVERHLAALQGRGQRPRLNGGNSADAAVIRKVKPNGLQRPTSNR